MTFIPIARELFPPVEPMAALARMRHLPNSLAFLSQGPVGIHSRYSYVMADPACFECWHVGDEKPDPLLSLGQKSNLFQGKTLPDLPPFQGGWAGMVGYGYGRAIEKLPAPRWDDYKTPDVFYGLYNTVYAFDRALGRAWLFSTGAESDLVNQRLDQLAFILEEKPKSPLPCEPKVYAPSVSHPLPGNSGVFSNFTRQGFEQAIARVIEYIRAGDCFQVNLAQHLASPLNGDPFLLLKALEQVNPAPFAGWLDWGAGQIVSASPSGFSMSPMGWLKPVPSRVLGLETAIHDSMHPLPPHYWPAPRTVLKTS